MPDGFFVDFLREQQLILMLSQGIYHLAVPFSYRVENAAQLWLTESPLHLVTCQKSS